MYEEVLQVLGDWGCAIYILHQILNINCIKLKVSLEYGVYVCVSRLMPSREIIFHKIYLKENEIESNAMTFELRVIVNP